MKRRTLVMGFILLLALATLPSTILGKAEAPPQTGDIGIRGEFEGHITHFGPEEPLEGDLAPRCPSSNPVAASVRDSGCGCVTAAAVAVSAMSDAPPESQSPRLPPK